MPRFRVLLRLLLIVTFCLEGSVSLWASSAMAVDGAHQAGATGRALPVAIDQDCADGAIQGEGSAVHKDCDLGCACACVFPVVAFVAAIPFAAQHLLASVPAVRTRLPVVVAATTPVFRPPIG